MVVFEEIPNEITLAINITNCPCKCPGCHSKFLWADTGIELTFDELDKLIKKNDGITTVCFMGGDSEPKYINELAEHIIKTTPDTIKVAWYSGRDTISDEIYLNNFDYLLFTFFFTYPHIKVFFKEIIYGNSISIFISIFIYIR